MASTTTLTSEGDSPSLVVNSAALLPWLEIADRMQKLSISERDNAYCWAGLTPIKLLIIIGKLSTPIYQLDTTYFLRG